MMNKISKTFMMSVIVMLVLGLTACGGATPTGEVPSVEKLTIGIWGGVWGDAYIEAAIKPFEEATGVTVDVVPNVESNLVLLASENERDEPLYDLLWVSDTEFYTASRAGLLAPVNYDNIAHAADLYDFGKEEFGVSGEIGAWGIAYNSNLIETPPTSWADLLDPDLATLTGIMTPSTSGADVHDLSILAIAAGGSPEDAGTLGIEVAKELVKNGAKFGDFGTIASLFANGEIGQTIFYHQEPIYYRQDGLPAEFVLPEEGAYIVGAFMVMPAKLPEQRKALTEELINYVVAPEAQLSIAETIFSGPINKTVVLDDELAAVVHPSSQAEFDSLIIPDWDFILDNVEDWLMAWEREVNP